jgi:hypothetical protein
MKDMGRTRRFLEHGRYDKRADARNGLNTLSQEKQKTMAEIRLRAERIHKKIKREGIG